MNEMVQIRSVKQYFNDYIVKGLEGKEKVAEIDLVPIKERILKSFKEEIFGQIYFKLGDKVKNVSRDDIANLEPVKNILQQSVRKWRRLCILCSEYGLGSFFQLDDIERVLTEEHEPDPDVVEIPEDLGEDVTDQLEEEPVYLEKEESEDA